MRADDATGAAPAGAGLGSRAYAFTVDWHIRVLAGLIWILGGYAAAGADWKLTLLPAGILYFFYHPALEVITGRTPGKKRAGLYVANRAGEPAGAGSALVRNGLRLIDSLPVFYGVGIIAALLDRDARRLGDRVAGTRLLLEPTRPEAFDQAGLARELLTRWPELEPGRRMALARRLLAGAGQDVVGADEHAVKRSLESLS